MAVKVKPFCSVAACVEGLVTVTSTGPTTCAGVTAVREVELLKVTEAALAVPKGTGAPEAKWVPVRVPLVPPAMPPRPGATLVTVSEGGPAVRVSDAGAYDSVKLPAE